MQCVAVEVTRADGTRYFYVLDMPTMRRGLQATSGGRVVLAEIQAARSVNLFVADVEDTWAVNEGDEPFPRPEW